MTAAILVGVLVAVPLLPGVVTGKLGRIGHTEGVPDNPVATGARSGVVKSVDAAMLVITRSGEGSHEMTFVLRPTTLREGPLGVGARVQVRFRTEGRTQVATAILATARK